MSDYDISKMDFKQLRNEVQLLRDELAIMKRKYEDAIYNIDTDNFSSRFVKEQGDMKSSVDFTAKKIETKVSKEDFESAISQTAESISSIVSEFVDVSKAVEVDSPDKFTDISKTYVIREKDEYGEVTKETFYHYNSLSKDWKAISADGIIYSLFEQKSDGFYLKGNVKVEGSCILTESLKFNSSDKPIQVEYSADGKTNWHTTFAEDSDEFMRLLIGAEWSDPMKIVGKDGEDGPPGAPGEDGEISYSTIAGILQNDYGIKSVSISGTSIAAPEIHSAQLFSPDIYGENITLTMHNADNSNIYNNMLLTPNGMSLINAYHGNEKEKFAIDLGEDSDNSYVLMRLGAGVDKYHSNSLIVEKYLDYIKIGSDTQSHDFVGLTITPSSGEMIFYGDNISFAGNTPNLNIVAVFG